MRRTLLFAFFSLLVLASLLGIGLAGAINYSLFGQPQEVLLKAMAATAAEGIDCLRPADSQLFRPKQTESIARVLDFVLIDAQDQTIASKIRNLDNAPLFQDESSFFYRLIREMPWTNKSIWVRLDNVCSQSWTLWVHDPENRIFRNLMMPRQLILYSFSSGCVLLAVGLAFNFLRRKGVAAQNILRRIRQGELGSRIQQGILEPRLQLITEFNAMAEAVEDLINRLKTAENMRTNLLAELAHDVRTPLASLRAAAETLQEFHSSMSEVQRQELQQTLMHDVLYFQRLIDDLLLLAQIDQIKLLPRLETIDMRELIQMVWHSSEDHSRLSAVRRELIWDGSCPTPLLIRGDAQLLRRLLQNTLVNAERYAQDWIRLRVHREKQCLRIIVSNNCKPLNKVQLEDWGHKRRQRQITEEAGRAHTSLGLGSSIIVEAARSHGGTAQLVQQILSPSEGAEVSVIIELPDAGEVS